MIKLEESEKLNNTSVAIGNFDGVHIAHKALIEKADEEKAGLKSVIYTFAPHPKKVFGKDFSCIQNDEEKISELMSLKSDYLFVKKQRENFFRKVRKNL